MDFFWINRDQKSFEWFVKLLSQLEIEQSEQDGVMGHFLDMHMYITSALQKTDMKAVGLQLALDLLHEKVTNISHCLILDISTISISGETRFGHRTQVTYHCWTAQLEQSFHSDPRAEQRPYYCLLLRKSYLGKSLASKVRRIRISIPKRSFLVLKKLLYLDSFYHTSCISTS